MKYIQKIVASSLILAIAFFAGEFCLTSLVAQAMEASSAMDMSEDSFVEDTVPTWNLCGVNCVKKVSPVAVVKKLNSDVKTDPSAYYDSQATISEEFSFDINNTSEIYSLVPDILSAVFKKE